MTPREPNVQQASHAQDDWDLAEWVTAAMTQAPTLTHLGHYTDGVDDVTADLVDDEEERAARVQMARLLSTSVSDLEADLIHVRTGNLIRVVLHARAAALYCMSVVPEQHVVGFATVEPCSPTTALSEAPDVRATDQVVAELAGQLRRRVSRGDLNPGGWHTERPPDDDPGGVVAPMIASLHVDGEQDGALADLCHKVVDPRDLHYVAFCEDSDPTFVIDCFGDPSMTKYFGKIISVPERRAFYERLARRLPELAGQFGRDAKPVLGGRLERFVLDVEQGAIYYYRVRPGQYLVGVTLSQDDVAPADDKMARLAVLARSL